MRFYGAFYGCHPVEQRHLLLILRPWGALAIFAGVIGFSAVSSPTGQPLLLGALALLLLLRIGYRVGLRRDLQEISGIAPGRNYLNIGLLGVGALLLLWGTWSSLCK